MAVGVGIECEFYHVPTSGQDRPEMRDSSLMVWHFVVDARELEGAKERTGRGGDATSKA